MKATRTAIGLLATAIAVAASPGAAGAAEYLVPPSNSAATQYTETLPTAGGQHDSEKGRDGDRPAPSVLGPGNASKLNRQGEAGRRVVEVVVATAPPTTPRPSSNAADGDNEREDDLAATGGNTGSGSGSSGLSEVLAQATGVSSSGQLGLLLPLAILGAVTWAFAFLWRARARSAP